MLRDALDKIGVKDVKINIISVSTFAINATTNIENPLDGGNSIDNQIQIYNISDSVQVKGTNFIDRENYVRTYNNLTTKNVKKDLTNVCPNTCVNIHMIDQTYPELIKQNIDSGLIPSISKTK
jgi:hypothetical protein